MNRRQTAVCLAGVILLCGSSAAHAAAAEWFVAVGGSGDGSRTEPFGRIQDGLNVAQPGDTVTVGAGTYAETLGTVRSGDEGLPIRLRAADARGSVLISVSGRVLTISHAYFLVEGLVLDGQYGEADTVRVTSSANYLVLRNLEIRRSTRDLIDISSPHGVLIEDCLIHHALNATGGRRDAHGIVAAAVRDLTIRHTEIHTFSGDGFQVDPARSVPGWNRVTLDSVRIWLAPLATAENGFEAGIVPGENAIDTKANALAERAILTVRNITASGFRAGLISNMAAFNLKENIDATFDGVTVFDSEIAFRLRGATTPTSEGAWVTLKNAVVYNVATSYRYENNVQNLRIWNNTVGKDVKRTFQSANSKSGGLDVRNLLVLGSRPAEASDLSNLAGGEDLFVDAAAHDYRLAPGAPAIDSGVEISDVGADRRGVQRPTGAKYDVGAYEWQPTDRMELDHYDG